MGITTSASCTASSAVAADLPPASSTGFSAAGLTSKARTWSCALSRLRAIGPPILPTPMNAMVVMRFLPSGVGGDVVPRGIHITDQPVERVMALHHHAAVEFARRLALVELRVAARPVLAKHQIRRVEDVRQ